MIENVFAANTAPTSPGTVANDATVGTADWTDDNWDPIIDNYEIVASDNIYAIANIYNATSHYLKATNFGFSIPTGATINGILVAMEERADILPGTTAKESAIRIVKSDGSIGTQNKSTGVTPPSSDTYVYYGASDNLWGETWTAEDINDTDFGVVFSTVHTGSFSGVNPRIHVDHIRITVYYTEAAGVETSSPVIFKPGGVFRSGVIFK